MTFYRAPNVCFATNLISALDIAMLREENIFDMFVSHGVVNGQPAIYLRDSESRRHIWVILPTDRKGEGKYRFILRERDELPYSFKPMNADRSCWVDYPPSCKHVYDVAIDDSPKAVQMVLLYLKYEILPNAFEEISEI